MAIAETRMNQAARLNAGSCDDPQNFKALYERLLNEQPESVSLLRRLQTRSRQGGGDNVFAAIEANRCSACNMTVASAQLQKAKAGAFINCAHCSIFLYHGQPL